MTQDLEKLKEWIGQKESGVDYVTVPAVHRLAATLDRDDPMPRMGDPLPVGWHQILFPRVVAMNIGGEDFALDLNAEPDDDVLLHPKQRMIIAARAAGVMPLGFIGTVADFSDWERFRQMVRRSRRFGFEGAGCIHPGQVKIVNEEYTPSADEVAYARKVIQMDREAQAAGRGSFQIDGKMIDIPVVVRAERLIRRYEAIKAREARTLAAAR